MHGVDFCHAILRLISKCCVASSECCNYSVLVVHFSGSASTAFNPPPVITKPTSTIIMVPPPKEGRIPVLKTFTIVGGVWGSATISVVSRMVVKRRWIQNNDKE